MKKITLLILFLITVNFGYGQTTLSAGDIAITGFNSDNPDQFSFVLLEDVLSTTQIKFTDEGEILISASLKELDNGKLDFQCVVADTGIGVPKNKQKTLFDLFSQADASTTRKYGGTGLGLSIVKKLCLMMGGDVELESSEGQGSRFKFNVTLEKVAGANAIKPSHDVSDLRILLVDDNLTNCVI